MSYFFTELHSYIDALNALSFFFVFFHYPVVRLGSDPEQLFPFEMMQNHLRQFGRFGMIMATMLLPILTSDDGHAVDMDDMCEKIKNGIVVDGSEFVSDESRTRLAVRLRDVIIDMVRLDYI